MTIGNNEFTGLHVWMDFGVPDPNYPPVAINPFAYGTNCANKYRIVGNFLHDYTDPGYGIIVNGGYPGQIPAQYTDMQVLDNTIRDIGLVGIRFKNRGPSGQEPAGGVVNGVISGNVVTGCQTGVLINGLNPGPKVNNNFLFGNSTFGLNNEFNPIIDGTCNWWGSSSGPTPVGTGDAVSTFVNYNPWLRIADVAPSSLSFGGKKVNVEFGDQTLSITNPDQSPCDNFDLTVESIVLPMADYTIVASSKPLIYPVPLATGETLTVTVRFLPLSLGEKNGRIDKEGWSEKGGWFRRPPFVLFAPSRMAVSSSFFPPGLSPPCPGRPSSRSACCKRSRP